MKIELSLTPILKQIVSTKNKTFVKELQGQGMRDEKIEQILRSDYYRNPYSLFPRDKILECKKNCLTLSRSMRNINKLLNDENILDAIKDPLLKELNRLRDLYDDQKWIATLDSVKKYNGPGNPKTWKQMIGFQVRLLYEYIKPLSESLNDERLGNSRMFRSGGDIPISRKRSSIRMQRDYRSQDVFELIRELLNVAGLVKLGSWKQVKAIYGNTKRSKGFLCGPTIKKTKGTKISAYEWEKIQKAY